MKLHRFLAVMGIAMLAVAVVLVAPGSSLPADAALFASLLPESKTLMFATAAGGIAIAEEVKQAVAPVMEAFEAFKETNDRRLAEIEKKSSADVITVEKLDRIEKTLSGYEGLNQRLVIAENQSKALKETSDRIEIALNRLPKDAKSRDDGTSVKSHADAWAKAVIRGTALGLNNLQPEEIKVLQDVAAECKALNVGTDTAGGYLAPIEYVREIIKGVTDISPARSIVRVRNTAMKSVQIPKRTGQFAARRVSEQGTKTETTGLTYGLEEINAPEMYAQIDISNQMLEDTAFDMEAEIRLEASEQFAVKEGAEFVSGAAKDECEGILTNTSVGYTPSGSAAVIADSNGVADGLLTLKHAIKSAYARNAKWIMNRTVIGAVRKLKTSDKQYIWMPGIQNGAPATIDGDPYVEFPDMPNEGAGLHPIAYGDFYRAYAFVDRIAMEMLRDPYTQATSGNIRFIFRRRLGGQVVLPEAIRKLRCATS
jgi:HK97 family phage major capsid protein